MNTAPPSETLKFEWKGWRVLLEFFGACIALGVGGELRKDGANLAPWVSGVSITLLFVGGILLVLHGVDCIRYRWQIAAFWAPVPGGSWFAKDPIQHHIWRVVPAGIISVLIGCVILLVTIGTAVKSING